MSRSSRVRRSVCSRAARSSVLRRAVRSASAPVASLKFFSDSESSASAAATRSSALTRLLSPASRSRRSAAGFFGQPRQRILRIRRQLPLARDVVVELQQPLRQFGEALLGARLLAVERIARGHEPLQRRARARLGLAQRRQRGRRPHPALSPVCVCASVAAATSRMPAARACSPAASSVLAFSQRRWNSVASCLRTCADTLR